MSSPANFNQDVIAEFRSNEGKVGGMFAGMSLLLLTAAGAKTGQRRTSPLAFFPDGDRLLIIGSLGGAPKHPAWYFNVQANPDVTVELGNEKFEARAEVLPDAERDALWPKITEAMPGFADYQKKTTRKIPVVALNRS